MGVVSNSKVAEEQAHSSASRAWFANASLLRATLCCAVLRCVLEVVVTRSTTDTSKQITREVVLDAPLTRFC